jgi:hypothetical protein
MARAAAIGNSSWVLPVRIAQLVFAILVFSLASYTLDKITGWKEVRFTVAAVTHPSFSPPQHKLTCRVSGPSSP